LKGSALREGLLKWAREVQEEKELDGAGGGEGLAAGGTVGATTGDVEAAVGAGQPDRVRSEANKVEISPRGKERSGETV